MLSFLKMAKIPANIKTGYDPKNREVISTVLDNEIIIEKPVTSFYFKTKDKELALKVFDQQINCSQNQ